MYLPASYAEYIKDAIIVIDKEQKDSIKACDEEVIDCDQEKTILEADLDSLRREIWVQYTGNKTRYPDDDSVFKETVFLAYQKLNLTQYIKTYETCCRLLRENALQMLGTINSGLAQYAASSDNVISMEINTAEQTMLDGFWVPSETTTPDEQKAQTNEDIKAIRKQMKQVSDILN
jgi:hypothetical protein